MAKQCRCKDFISGQRCQGVSGHDGAHWAYGSFGQNYQWVVQNKFALGGNIAHTITPPDAKTYISPDQRVKEYFNYYA